MENEYVSSQQLSLSAVYLKDALQEIIFVGK